MFISTPDPSVNSTSAYVSSFWDELVNDPSRSHSSLPLAHPYVTPSKKFDALFYWDVYFEVLGLLSEGRYELAEGCVRNFFDEVSLLGFVPNFNSPRGVSKTRSQPPFLSQMVLELYSVGSDTGLLRDALGPLLTEYRYWTTPPKLAEFGLSRYYDSNPLTSFTQLATIAESGWDFTNRFRKAKKSLPVDLNALLFQYEVDIPHIKSLLGELDAGERREWGERRARRSGRVRSLMWDSRRKFFYDYSTYSGKVEESTSLAGFFPMWAGMVDHQVARLCGARARQFLYPGGFVTTLDSKVRGILNATRYLAKQWCFPAGWAPLQWIACRALAKYGYDDLAAEGAYRFTSLVARVFRDKGKVYEKYNVVDRDTRVRSMYPMHTGFGWTNGVFQALLARIVLGIEPLPGNEFEFSPRVPRQWRGAPISAQFEDFPKLGSTLGVSIDQFDPVSGRAEFHLAVDKPTKCRLNLPWKGQWDSVVVNGEEVGREFSRGGVSLDLGS
ncbi:MAG: trehalase family glycosidase [Promethearchaeota archaeon]